MTLRLTPLLLAGLLLAAAPAAQAQKKNRKTTATTIGAGGNAESAIKEADIKRDLFALADDKYRGREGGTLDELRASSWLAEQIRAIGMEPAGDDGTYFQWFNLQRTRLTQGSTPAHRHPPARPDHDAVITAPTNASVTAPLVFVGTATPAELAKVDVKGKAVALQISGAPTDGISYRRYLFGKLRDQAAELIQGRGRGRGVRVR